MMPLACTPKLVTVAALLAGVACSPAAARIMPAATAPPPASSSTSTVGATATHGMVVSASGIASRAGRDVLAAGGNAVDAAIATGLALAVTYPVAGNIGGGGFMVIRLPDGRATTFDFREAAPAAASPTMFLDSAGNYSARIHHNSLRSVGVPGTVAGFALAHRTYGHASWSALVEPAVRLAREGYDVTPGVAGSLRWSFDQLSAFPASVASFHHDGVTYAAGERLRQPDLARTLARIRDRGRDGFYAGETARLIAAEMRRGGGLITEADLAGYQAVERPPVRGTYRGFDIISMPPPSSGGVALIEMLNILEGYDLAAAGHDSPRYVHLLAEAMRRAFRDRARSLGDPSVAAVPVERLVSKAYATTLRAGIEPERASVSDAAQASAPRESDQTTHYSVVDASGMAVSVTYTLEGGFGLGAVVPGAGFLLNNEMGDFNGKPGLTDSTGLIGTDANLARPGKRMLSSMTPTIVARDGRLFAVVGSPGGRTIINTVLQVILNQIDGGMSLADAVAAKRFHHQWLPDRLFTEPDALSAGTVRRLEATGYRISAGGAQGTAHSIRVDHATGQLLGIADQRDADAGAAGY